MSAMRRPDSAGRAIPGVLLQFLERASVSLGCTRDEKLVPRIHWASGWQVDPDARSLWAFVPKAFAAGLREAADAKAPFALTVEHIGPHETYQFKGRLIEARAATEPDRALVARARERFAAAVVGLLPHFAADREKLRSYIWDPALAVRMSVREIYLQTPGPGAGSLLVRLEDDP
jgi:hypothetical protein